jgi:folate-binding protein YgfZ
MLGKETVNRHNQFHTAITQIEPRTLFRISGADATKFLQGMVTNNVAKCSQRGDSMHLCFLTPKGRVQHDAILICEEPKTDSLDASSFIVDCAASQAATLRKHLRRYKLRSKVVLEDMSETYSVHVAIPEQAHPEAVSMETQRAAAALLHAQDGGTASGSPPIAYLDPREACLGFRLIVATANLESINSVVAPKLREEGFTVDVCDMRNEYEALCLVHGILSGDAISGRIPLECNMEWTNAIAFDKGCYLGQELVARTHFKGQVRKRVIPFYTVDSEGAKDGVLPLPLASLMTAPQSGSFLEPYSFLTASRHVVGETGEAEGLDILNLETGKVVGKVETLSGHFNVGMAQIRLEHMFDVKDGESTAKDTTFVLKAKPHIRVVPFLPHWWAKEV